MNATKPKSIAAKEAEARKASVLLRHAYLYDSAKGRLLAKDYPKAGREILEIFEEMVEVAVKYRKLTGRHLPILGELGELFAEIMFGIKRHDPMTRGSDGMLGKDFVEVKTITPAKRSFGVRVKRSGNFGKLVVVRISDDFQFAARMVDRRILGRGNGKWATLSWDAMIVGETDQELHRIFPIKKPSPKSEPAREWLASRSGHRRGQSV